MVVDARTKAGQTVAVFFAQLLLNEFDMAAFTVERVPRKDGFARSCTDRHAPGLAGRSLAPRDALADASRDRHPLIRRAHMSLLPTERTPPKRELSDLIIVEYGFPKAGKTTWASHVPKSVFLATESGQNAHRVLPGGHRQLADLPHRLQ